MSFMKSVFTQPEAKFSDHSDDTRWSLTKSMENPSGFMLNLFAKTDSLLGKFFNTTESRRMQALDIAETTLSVVNEKFLPLQPQELRQKLAKGYGIGQDYRANVSRVTSKDSDRNYDYEVVQKFDLVDPSVAPKEQKPIAKVEALALVNGNEVGYQSIRVNGNEILPDA